eukprot:TRINITY_DN57008_c0_g1_i1.p1 TRINITY_DN57008_c0_g1~~TRINITY_DN57008_c0_g1_i1.p1  ORF type:complete len:426 (+),score=79.35 TRINITY_DN57008_c0_g1_i1:81-1280(+)
MNPPDSETAATPPTDGAAAQTVGTGALGAEPSTASPVGEHSVAAKAAGGGEEVEAEEELESLRDRCASLEVRNARLLDEIATLRGRVEIDLPHWAGKVKCLRDKLDERLQPLASTPLGASLLEYSEGLYEIEAGLRGLRGTPLREELCELRRAFSNHMADAAAREDQLRKELAALRQPNAAMGGASAASPTLPVTASVIANLEPQGSNRQRSRPTIIGVTGPSGSGKSTIAKKLAQKFQGEYFGEDPAFFRLPWAEYSKRDVRYERCENVDWDKAVAALRQTIAQTAADSTGLIFVEHYLLLAADSSLLPFIDYCIFLDPTAGNRSKADAIALCCQRRIARNPARSNEESADLRAYYQQAVWPCYEENQRLRKENAVLSWQKGLLEDGLASGQWQSWSL